MKNNIYTKSGTNFLNLIKSFFEEGRSFNNNFNNKNPLPINFFFKIIKKSNLILGIKLIPISNKEISINKIILYDNFKIFEKNKLIENNKIIFEKTEGNLIDNYFEIKLLEMNIIGNNFIYEIEFNYTNENELILLETYKYSCNLIEEFSYDENFELFFNEFNSNKINDSTNGHFLLNIILIFAFTLFLFFVLLILCCLNRRNLSSIKDSSDSNLKTNDRIKYENLEMSKNVTTIDENPQKI